MDSAISDAGVAAAEPTHFLLGCFADFYEEVADIKLAAARGEAALAVYLAAADGSKPVSETDFAARVSSRLEGFLRQQASDVQRKASVSETKMYALAQFIMTAVADEIFVLDLSWRGRDAWMPFLLEQKLFKSCNAGTRFFELARQLLHTHNPGPLHLDAAGVFLLALQLGFRGRYRGAENAAALREIRHQLLQLADASRRGEEDGKPAFEQAYQHRLSGSKDERLAPLSRWRMAALIALLTYLTISTLVWAASIHPLMRLFRT